MLYSHEVTKKKKKKGYKGAKKQKKERKKERKYFFYEKTFVSLCLRGNFLSFPVFKKFIII